MATTRKDTKGTRLEGAARVVGATLGRATNVATAVLRTALRRKKAVPGAETAIEGTKSAVNAATKAFKSATKTARKTAGKSVAAARKSAARVQTGARKAVKKAGGSVRARKS